MVTSNRLRGVTEPGHMAPERRHGGRLPSHGCAAPVRVDWGSQGLSESSRHLGVRRSRAPHLYRGDVTPGPRKSTKVVRTLRTALANAPNRDFHQKTTQGKVMECVAADQSSFHFLRTGQFTRFADWHFGHRAPLNVVPLTQRGLELRPTTNGEGFAALNPRPCRMPRVTA